MGCWIEMRKGECVVTRAGLFCRPESRRPVPFSCTGRESLARLHSRTSFPSLPFDAQSPFLFFAFVSFTFCFSALLDLDRLPRPPMDILTVRPLSPCLPPPS